MSGFPESLSLVVNLGSVAILCIEGSYVPQIVRLFRLKHADDVSVFFPSLNLFGRGLAVIYSLGQNQPVFVAGFALGMLLRAILLGQVVYYRWRHGRPVLSMRPRATTSADGAALSFLGEQVKAAEAGRTASLSSSRMGRAAAELS
jgi:lipid-A-disaccharide synthase-like uncharacterized protein